MRNVEFSLKNTGLAIAAQFLAIILIWTAALAMSPALDSLLELMVYFYWPLILLVGTVVASGGESSMFAAIIFGIILGIIVYGCIFSIAFSLLKRVKTR